MSLKDLIDAVTPVDDRTPVKLKTKEKYHAELELKRLEAEIAEKERREAELPHPDPVKDRWGVSIDAAKEAAHHELNARYAEQGDTVVSLETLSVLTHKAGGTKYPKAYRDAFKDEQKAKLRKP